MAREIDLDRTRIVVTGDDAAPAGIVLEYTVKDGDLAEDPSSVAVEGATSADAALILGVAAAKAKEGIA
jgi:hypothetical protein